jgi:hypothetical protein
LVFSPLPSEPDLWKLPFIAAKSFSNEDTSIDS